MEDLFDERVFRTLFRALSHARMGGKPLVSVLEVKHHYSFLATRMGVPAKAFFEELPVSVVLIHKNTFFHLIDGDPLLFNPMSLYLCSGELPGADVVVNEHAVSRLAGQKRAKAIHSGVSIRVLVLVIFVLFLVIVVNVLVDA